MAFMACPAENFLPERCHGDTVSTINRYDSWTYVATNTNPEAPVGFGFPELAASSPTDLFPMTVTAYHCDQLAFPNPMQKQGREETPRPGAQLQDDPSFSDFGLHADENGETIITCAGSSLYTVCKHC